MVNRNCIEPNKLALVGWVHKALNRAHTRKNIIYQGSKVRGFGNLIG